jgi:hypothetical protein
MTLHDSESALAGKAAASLTASVRRGAQRGRQSSGLFDLDSLFSMRVSARIPPPLPSRAHPREPWPPSFVPLTQAPWPQVPAAPVAEHPRRPELKRTAFVVPVANGRADETVRVDRSRAARAGRQVRGRVHPRPIGWFARMTMWLATMSLTALAATQLPAHLGARPRAMAASASLAPTTTSAGPTAGRERTQAPTASAPAPGPPAASATPPSPLGGVPAGWVPAAAPVSAGQPAAASAASAPVAPPATAGWAASAVRAMPALAVASQGTRTPPRVEGVRRAAVHPSAESRPTAAPPAISPRAAAASPPPASGGSLEDLIRREVAAEQKRVHAAH